MKVFKINGKTGTSEIVIGESIKNLSKYSKSNKCVIVTDTNVNALCGAFFPSGFEVIEIGIGEQNKTLSTVEKLYEKFLEFGLDRASYVIGIGGGIVCDVTGFAASTYLRGIRFGFVPTTLLAQVDASLGGKNGVNFKGYKNLIGTFNQPEFVLCDFEMLKTLPIRELKSGFAEIIKHAIIADIQLFSYLEKNYENALSLHRTEIEKILYDSFAVKSKIVSMDETEKGERRKLNFGHTLGHAIEKTTGLLHGEAISIGIIAAAKLSLKKGMLTQKDAERVENLISKFGLPTKIKMDKIAVIDAIEKDKKRENKKIRFVLLEKLGRAKIIDIEIDELKGVVSDMC